MDLDVTEQVIAAPAKLTLSLRITGIRSDGYHLLEAEMVSLDLADTLSFEDAVAPSGNELTIAAGADGPCAARDVALVPQGADNLVVRALLAVGRTASVHLTKRIPSGAGLGGGSSDAAAVLRWAGCSDLGLAASLGADVPFCVGGGRAMVRGIGEVIEPLSHEDRSFLLLLLPFGVDTGAAYRAWDELADGRLSGEGLAGDTQRSPEESSRNDLEDAALRVEPRLGPWKARLEELTRRRAHLAGSGSTWFVEGSAEELGVHDGQPVQLGNETGVLVAVRTLPPVRA
jgi:4-diphosphocytidyl-2-C-methyl-D-erythritol kinase